MGTIIHTHLGGELISKKDLIAHCGRNVYNYIKELPGVVLVEDAERRYWFEISSLPMEIQVLIYRYSWLWSLALIEKEAEVPHSQRPLRTLPNVASQRKIQYFEAVRDTRRVHQHYRHHRKGKE
ncbi:MAG: hypothetical protein SPK09_02810 [Porphyromonas sp.]|nr:hypothetical protein [Porphyromonas sp.]